MDTRSYGCSRFLAVLFAIAAALCLAAGLFTWTADYRLLRAQVYQQALRDQDVYAKIPGVTARLLIAGAAGTGSSAPSSDLLNVALRSLTPDQVESILSTVFPRPWLQSQVEPMVDELLAFLRGGGRGMLRMPISFVEPKQALRGEAGLAAAVQVMNSLPACTPDQLAQFAVLAASQALSPSPAQLNIDSLPVCKPPAEVLPLVQPALQYILDQTAASIPEETDLGEQIGPLLAQVFLQPGMQVLPYLVWALRLAPLAGLFFLGVLTALVVRSLRSALRWWSAPVLFSGLAGLLTCLALFLLSAQIGAVFTQISTGAVELSGVTGLLGSVFQQAWSGFLLWAGGGSAILFGVGALGWLVSLAVPE